MPKTENRMANQTLTLMNTN